MKTSVLSSILILALLTSLSFALEALSSRDYQDANRLYAAGKFPDALVRYRQALAARPADRAAGDVQCRIGDIYFRMGDYPNALSSYRNALGDRSLRDRAQTQYWVGFCCFLVGRDADAVTELLKVPALYPEARAWGSTSYYWAGRASERMGKKEQAAMYYRKAGGSGKSTQGKFAMKKADAVRGTSTKSQATNAK